MKKYTQGFTMVELIVVIAILGILSALAAPYIISANEAARGRKVLADLRTIDQAANVHYVQKGAWPAAVTDKAVKAKEAQPLGDPQGLAGAEALKNDFVPALLNVWPMPPTGRFRIMGIDGKIYVFENEADSAYEFINNRATLGGKTIEYYLQVSEKDSARLFHHY